MNNEDLFVQIENLRIKMISVGLAKGFTSVETVRLSERLDKLINLQMGLLSKISA
ncbi:aspartyl-phosphate phosphatase Spo0E family protein [Bacillus sp. sid0103]|uniref:aspartyl-phosphate phosphatase Spo0E family protein n=1 Tax=Bacillus sp. sid0103 TaxID=2856337 RepID=UPI001C47439A|nr:aspartyl-phosphate phosphatase Spo0E family protein [Bacillus sp. sid0103]MBV7504183.1 aspartyl-phosphate phosphatase Spo0E family protein [Bacillus sp. sid0103]